MIHPDPAKRAKIYTEEPKDEDYLIEKSDWYTQTREATVEEVQQLFSQRGLKIQEVPVVQIDEKMEESGEEKKEQGTGGSRVPGRARRTVFNNQQEQMRYDEIIDIVSEKNKESQIQEYISYKLINTNI